MTKDPGLRRATWRAAALGLGAAILLAAAVAAAGASPWAALQALADSAFGNPTKTSNTLKEATPLLMAGLAVYVALRAGLFNIGVEGQISIGALCAAVPALLVPGAPGMLLGGCAAVLGGALWALPAGWIRAYRGGHEVISTIMLNNVASSLTLALVAGPLRDPGQQGTTTRDIEATIPLALDSGRWEVSWALPAAIALVAAFALWLRKSVSGYELRLTGDNPRAAEFAGIDVRWKTMMAMVASGAISGLTGAVLTLGFEHRFFHGISSGYGFDALGVAMLSGPSPYGMLGSALLFGILNKGSSALQILGIPKGITWIVLGMLILVFAALRYRRLAAR